MNLLSRFLAVIVSPQLCLNVLGTLHGVHHGRKVHQEGIPHNFDDVPVMLSHRLVDDLVMSVQ